MDGWMGGWVDGVNGWVDGVDGWMDEWIDLKKEKGELEDACQVELEDGTVYKLSASKWNLIIAEGLKACGYLEKEAVQNITIKSCTPYIEEKRKK